ncbi:MAG TPA: hypothetical protein VMT21_07720 [Gemmatimonadales bacterium]|nr:hypothetical protein [Gemmatimonadales bacterium]
MWCSRTIRSRRAERGFVLATTLLVTTLLTVMLAASFLLVSAEQRTTGNSFGTARALALAQAGLQNYFSLNRALADTSTYDSIHVVLPNGYADVVAKRVRPIGAGSGSNQALFVVRSSGVATSPVQVGQVQGSRTIAQLAQLNPSHLPARAAMVALNGVRINGPSGSHPVSGNDLGSISPCVSPGGYAADTFAISYANGYNPGTAPTPDGYPWWAPVEGYGSWSPLYDSTHVDWASIVSGNLIPDATIAVGAPQTSPPWPVVGANTYNVAYVPGDVTIPVGQMRGVLVVKGNVTVQSGTHWDGIILAGGQLILSPANLTNYNIHGMIVTGLNLKLGQAVSQNVLQRGSTNVQWTWCYTQSSINSLSSLVPIKNGWADTWTTY